MMKRHHGFKRVFNCSRLVLPNIYIKAVALHLFFGLSFLFFVGYVSNASDSHGSIDTEPDVDIERIIDGLRFIDPVARGDSLLQLGVDLQNARKIQSALSVFNRVLNIGQKENDLRLVFLAKNNMGMCYFISLEYARALDYFYQAHEIAIRHLPPRFELVVLNNISLVYSEDHQYERALHFLNRAYEGAIAHGFSSRVANYGVNLGTLYNTLGEYEKAREVLKRSMDYSEPGSENYYFAIVNLAESYQNENDLETAYSLLKGLIQESETVSNNILVFAFLRSAHILDQLEKTEEALNYAYKGLEVAKASNKINHMHFAHTLLNNMHADMGNYYEAYKALQSAKELNSEILELKNQEQLAEIQAKFEVSRFEYELEMSEEKYAAMQRMYMIIILILVGLGISLAYTIRTRWINMRQKESLLQKKEQITALELEKSEEQRIRLEQEITLRAEQTAINEKLLKEELEKKNTEMASKLLVSAAKNDVISQVIEHLEQHAGTNEDLRTIKSKLKNTVDLGKDWDDFVVHFERTHYGFFQRLMDRHPELNNNELRFAAYLKINLDGKEIARLLHITPASYRKRKMRLKEKFGLDKGENLERYIHSL